MAQITAVQYAGFTVTPAIGSFFNTVLDFREKDLRPLDDATVSHWAIFSPFSAPAYFMMLLCVVALVLLHNNFEDRIPQKKKKAVTEISDNDDMELLRSSGPSCIMKFLRGYSLNTVAIIICMLLNVVTKGCIACFETIGVESAILDYGLSPSEAGAIVSTCGSLGVIVLLAMGYIQSFLSDVEIILNGIFVMIFALLFLLIAPSIMPGSFSFIVGIFLIYR